MWLTEALIAIKPKDIEKMTRNELVYHDERFLEELLHTLIGSFLPLILIIQKRVILIERKAGL